MQNNRSTKWFIIAALLISQIAAAESDVNYGRYLPSDYSENQQIVLVNWNSTEGKKRFFRSTHNGDFFRLAHHYQPQANPLYCGIASSVIVLNALRVSKNTIPSQPALEITKPAKWGGGKIDYPLYSQTTFLNAQTDKVKHSNIIELANAATNENLDPGLALHHLKGVLESYNAEVRMHYADGGDAKHVQMFRDEVKSVLQTSEAFIIVNYKSNRVGQAGGGHISPLGAYDTLSDSVLLLDVSGHLNPWVWIPLKDLYHSMHTLDGPRYRGYLIVGEKT